MNLNRYGWIGMYNYRYECVDVYEYGQMDMTRYRKYR